MVKSVLSTARWSKDLAEQECGGGGREYHPHAPGLQDVCPRQQAPQYHLSQKNKKNQLSGKRSNMVLQKLFLS